MLNVSSDELKCFKLALALTNKIEMECELKASQNIYVTVSLYDSLFSDLTLAFTKTSVYIYPAPTTQCDNSMCDLCSSLNG